MKCINKECDKTPPENGFCSSACLWWLQTYKPECIIYDEVKSSKVVTGIDMCRVVEMTKRLKGQLKLQKLRMQKHKQKIKKMVKEKESESVNSRSTNVQNLPKDKQ